MGSVSQEWTRSRGSYRRLAIEWSEARDDPEDAYRLFRVHNKFYKKVRDSAEGRVIAAYEKGDCVSATAGSIDRNSPVPGP
jgi:hypothetical protein